MTHGSAAVEGAPVPSRLVVAWQHPISRTISPVGFLEWAEEGYRFFYIQNALGVDGFRPLMGFPNLFQVYESSKLFPLFAQRVMSARRPEFDSFLAELDLPRAHSATPMEILARSGGRRVGDTLQLIPVPAITSTGMTSTEFLINGLRHRLDDPQVERAVGLLRVGDPLTLLDEPDNPMNARAIVALCENGVVIGWVPDLLLDYVHEVRRAGVPDIRVLHVNDPSSPPHLRVLVKLSGRVEAQYRPFSGPAWRRAAQPPESLVAV